MLAAAAAGCGAVGRVTSGDPAHGKELFLASTSKGSCSACHTLADAGSKGTIGPNLDDAFSSDKAQGFSQQTMADIVRGQIAYPEPPMPANIYEGQDAKDVALYVAKCSANPGCGVTAEKPATAAGGAGGGTPPSGGSAGGTAAPNGKQVFLSAGCGTCHTLKAAGSTGTVGPNLDALKPSESKVQHQVENGGAVMPAFKGRLTPAQIAAVAKFVATSAGK